MMLMCELVDGRLVREAQEIVQKQREWQMWAEWAKKNRHQLQQWPNIPKREQRLYVTYIEQMVEKGEKTANDFLWGQEQRCHQKELSLQHFRKKGLQMAHDCRVYGARIEASKDQFVAKAVVAWSTEAMPKSTIPIAIALVIAGFAAATIRF